LRCGAIGYARYIRHYPAGLGIVQVYICISKLKEKGNRKKHLPENMPRWHGVSSMPALGLNSGATVGTNFFLRARPTQPCGQARRWEDGFFYTEASIAGIARVRRSSCRSGRAIPWFVPRVVESHALEPFGSSAFVARLALRRMVAGAGRSWPHRRRRRLTRDFVIGIEVRFNLCS